MRHRGNPATTDIFMTLDTPDALAFNETVTIIAAELAAFGDTDPVDVRRARAVGIMADPQHALNIFHGLEGTPSQQTSGAMNLFLHLTPDDLQPETGAVTIEKLGAATTDLLHDWLTRHTATGGRINVRPVLDLTDTAAVDRHDPPDAMRELVMLRDAPVRLPRLPTRLPRLRPRPHHPLPADG